MRLGQRIAHGKCRDIIRREKKVGSPSNARPLDFVWERAKNCYIWDADGNRYLDFAAAIAVMNVGHSNPEVVKAVQRQAAYSLHGGYSDFYGELPVRLIEKVLSFMPSGFERGFLSNSGTESVEAAFKLARWHTNKKWVIAFKNAFHGRTMGSLSMTNSKKVQRERFSPFLPVQHVPFAYPYRSPYPEDESKCAAFYLEQVRKAARKRRGNLAAIFVEPIQGEGGYIVPPAAFHKGLREIVDEYDALLVADEVQSGCFRTGTFLAMQQFGVKPDIVALSKAVGGGIPLGITLARTDIMDWVPGSHSNTFGGNLIACVAGIATLDYMKKNALGKNAERIGKFILKQLAPLEREHPNVGEVRGKGLMIGAEFVADKKRKTFSPALQKAVMQTAWKNGLVLLPAGKSTIRICPPLTLTKEQARVGVEIFTHAIRENTK